MVPSASPCSVNSNSPSGPVVFDWIPKLTVAPGIPCHVTVSMTRPPKRMPRVTACTGGGSAEILAKSSMARTAMYVRRAGWRPPTTMRMVCPGWAGAGTLGRSLPRFQSASVRTGTGDVRTWYCEGRPDMPSRPTAVHSILISPGSWPVSASVMSTVAGGMLSGTVVTLSCQSCQAILSPSLTTTRILLIPTEVALYTNCRCVATSESFTANEYVSASSSGSAAITAKFIELPITSTGLASWGSDVSITGGRLMGTDVVRCQSMYDVCSPSDTVPRTLTAPVSSMT